MESYTVEQVEFLRQRADITYEEALDVLRRCNGDLTRCLVDLERRGLIRKERGKTYHAQKSAHAARAHASRNASFQEGSSLGSMLKKVMSMRLVVTKNARTYVDLSIVYLALAALCAPHLMLFTVIAMFVMGLKIRVESGDGKNVGNDQFYDTVDKVADNIKSTVGNFARATRESSEKTRRADVEKNTPYYTEKQPEPDAERQTVYAQPAAQTAPPQTEAHQADVCEADIPDVTPYEEFTGQESAEKAEETEADENELTIGHDCLLYTSRCV